jgi:hypothetical protein
MICVIAACDSSYSSRARGQWDSYFFLQWMRTSSSCGHGVSSDRFAAGPCWNSVVPKCHTQHSRQISCGSGSLRLHMHAQLVHLL